MNYDLKNKFCKHLNKICLVAFSLSKAHNDNKDIRTSAEN